MNIYLSSITFT